MLLVATEDCSPRSRVGQTVWIKTSRRRQRRTEEESLSTDVVDSMDRVESSWFSHAATHRLEQRHCSRRWQVTTFSSQCTVPSYDNDLSRLHLLTSRCRCRLQRGRGGNVWQRRTIARGRVEENEERLYRVVVDSMVWFGWNSGSSWLSNAAIHRSVSAWGTLRASMADHSVLVTVCRVFVP